MRNKTGIYVFKQDNTWYVFLKMHRLFALHSIVELLFTDHHQDSLKKFLVRIVSCVYVLAGFAA